MDYTMATSVAGAAMDPQRGSQLAQMPAELLHRITYYLSTTDLGSARLVCKAVEQKLFKFFAHEFFRKRQFMVSDFSLQALADIARHPALGPELRHLIIGTDALCVKGARWNLSTSSEQGHQVQLFRASREYLVAGGLGDRLVHVFRVLPNLETIEIRDFDSPTRMRDDAKWSSYGARTLRRLTGLPVCHSHTARRRLPGNNCCGPGDASSIFAAVLTALALSDARPRNIQLCLKLNPVRDLAFFIPPVLETETWEALAGLETLHLFISPDGESGLVSAIDPALFVKRFLAFTVNLHWLRLNFDYDVADYSCFFLRWFSSTTPTPSPDFEAFFDKHAAPVAFPALTRLDLGRVTVEVTLLSSVLLKLAPTLRHLCLRRVTLSTQSEAADDWDPPNPWTAVLAAAFRSPGDNDAAVTDEDDSDAYEVFYCGLKLAAIELSDLECQFLRLQSRTLRCLFTRTPSPVAESTGTPVASTWSRFNITDYDRLLRDLTKEMVIMWRGPEGSQNSSDYENTTGSPSTDAS